MFKRILVPLDGSPRAERALPVAARLARASGGSVILVQALSVDAGLYLAPEPTVAASRIDTKFAKAEQYLRHIATSTELMGLSTKVVALYGAAAPTLLSVADYYGANLIVMCSHGYTGVKRWILGSVAEKVVHHTSVPVLVLRESGPVPTGSHPDATRLLRLLVPLDGSALAQVAIEPGAYLIAALAAPAQGALHLVRIVKLVTREEELQSLDLTTPKNSLHKAKEYMFSTAEHLREGLVAPAVAQLKLPITWSVVVDTDVAKALTRVAENGGDAGESGGFGGYDVIAMATHARSGLQRWALGSITEQVLHDTQLPLLIVHPVEMMDRTPLIMSRPRVTVTKE